MAAIYQEHSENGQGVEFSRQDIQSAIAKAVELRALHAALMQGRRSPPTSTYSASPVSRHAPHYSAQDYPVFTPVRVTLSFPFLHPIINRDLYLTSN